MRVEQEIRFEPYLDDVPIEVASAPTIAVALPIFSHGLHSAAWWRLGLKRSMDVVASALGLILLAPLFLIVGLLVVLTSGGPAFFVQRRVGRDGRPFSMVKFRSMYRDAHAHRDEQRDRNMHEGPIFKVRDDPRITPIGRVIRRLSIDELPQLFNVFVGDMSLVGPRPCLPEEFREYGERERRRLLVRPGITCIWQVSGRSDVDFSTWVDMDLDYISSWSLLLDLKLLALTLPAVVSGRGAY
jgi:lipopolysaccharide/colanic/teichoic acid biosynthesis glycosyltransferase